MTTAVGILDRDAWTANTDVLVVVDPRRRRLTWVPRDLWCPGLGDRVNAALARGGHPAVRAALAEHGLRVDHGVYLRRAATERFLATCTVRVPVPRRLEFYYPLTPTAPLEEGVKIVTFEPPEESLSGERIHQWIGARSAVPEGGTDLDRIERQQCFLRRLLQAGGDLTPVLSDPERVRVSGPAALAELGAVRPGWRFATHDAVVPATVAGREVLLADLRPPLLRRLARLRPTVARAVTARTGRHVHRLLVIPSGTARRAPEPRRVRLLAVVAVHDEADRLPGLLANLAPQVDGIVALDDGSSDGSGDLLAAHPAVVEVLRNPPTRPRWDEPANHRRLVQAAHRHGAEWILAVDADERLEREFRARAERVIRRGRRLGLEAYAVRLRELWGSATTYRADGRWGRKKVVRLFRALPDHRFDLRPLHGGKGPRQARVLGGWPGADLELYHLRMIAPQDRAARRRRYERLDPESRWQPGVGYAYLTDETGLRLRRVDPRRGFAD